MVYPLHQLLERIARGLEDSGIPYMIIGGQAVLLHGEPRFTEDIDVTLGVAPDSLGSVLKLVRHWNWRISVEPVEEFVRRTMILPCVEPQSGIRVDFVFSFSPYERQAIERALNVELGRAKVKFVTAEDLVIHKIVAGRPRDLEDIRGVMLKHAKLDRGYVERWLMEFERSLNEPYLERFKSVVNSLPKLAPKVDT